MIRHLGKFSNYEAVKAALEAGTLAEPYVALDVSSNVSSLVLPEGDNPVYINYRRDVPVKLVDLITLQDYYCATSPYLNAKINIPLVFDYIGNYTPSVRVIDKSWFIKKMEEDNLTEAELITLCFSDDDSEGSYRNNEFNYKSTVPENFTFERPVTWLSGKGFNNDGGNGSAGDDLPVPCAERPLQPLGYGTDRQGYYIILAAFLDPVTGQPGENLTFKVGEYKIHSYLTPDSSLVSYGMQFSVRSFWWEDEEQTSLNSWYAVPQNSLYDKVKFIMYWAEDYSTPAEAMSASTPRVYDVTPSTDFYFDVREWDVTNTGTTTLHVIAAAQLYNSTSGATSPIYSWNGPEVPGQGEEPIPPTPDASGTHVYQIYNLMEHNNNGFYDSSVYVDGSTKVEFYGNVLADGYYTHGIFENSSVEIAMNPGYYGSEFRIFTVGSEYYLDRGSEENCYRINGGNNDGGMHTCEFGNFYIKIDGSVEAEGTAFDDSNSQALYSRVPLGIFGVYADGQATPADGSVNLGYFKIYDGSTLIRDFVPAVNDSSVVGLLDKVNYKFYTNQVQGQGVVSDHLGFISVTTDASGNVIDTSTDITTPWWEEFEHTGYTPAQSSGDLYTDLENNMPSDIMDTAENGDVVLLINAIYDGTHFSGGRAAEGTLMTNDGVTYLVFADCSIGYGDSLYIIDRYFINGEAYYEVNGLCTQGESTLGRIDYISFHDESGTIVLGEFYGPNSPMNNPATRWYENVNFSHASGAQDTTDIMYGGSSIQYYLEDSTPEPVFNSTVDSSTSAISLVIGGEYDNAGHLTGGRCIPGVINQDYNGQIVFREVNVGESDSMTLVVDHCTITTAPFDSSVEIINHDYLLIRDDEAGENIGILYEIGVQEDSGSVSMTVTVTQPAQNVGRWSNIYTDDQSGEMMIGNNVGVSWEDIDTDEFYDTDNIYLQVAHYYQNEYDSIKDSSTFNIYNFLNEHSEFVKIDMVEQNGDIITTPFAYDSSTDEIPASYWTRVCMIDSYEDRDTLEEKLYNMLAATVWQGPEATPDGHVDYTPIIDSDSSTLTMTMRANDLTQAFGYTYARYGIYTDAEYDASVRVGGMDEMEFFESKMTYGPVDVSNDYDASVGLVEGLQEFIAQAYNPTTQEYWNSMGARHGVIFPEPLTFKAEHNEDYVSTYTIDVTAKLSPAHVNDGWTKIAYGSYNKSAWDNDDDGIQEQYDSDENNYRVAISSVQDSSILENQIEEDPALNAQLLTFALPYRLDGNENPEYDWDNYHDAVFDIYSE